MTLLDVLNGFSAAVTPVRGAQASEGGGDAVTSASDFESLVSLALQTPGDEADVASPDDDDADDAGEDVALLLAMTGVSALALTLQTPQAETPSAVPAEGATTQQPSAIDASSANAAAASSQLLAGSISSPSTLPAAGFEVSDATTSSTKATDGNSGILPNCFPSPSPSMRQQPGPKTATTGASADATPAGTTPQLAQDGIDTPAVDPATVTAPPAAPVPQVPVDSVSISAGQSAEPARDVPTATGSPSRLRTSVSGQATDAAVADTQLLEATPRMAPAPSAAPASQAQESSNGAAVPALQPHVAAAMPPTPERPRAHEGKKASPAEPAGAGPIEGPAIGQPSTLPFDGGSQTSGGEGRFGADAPRTGETKAASEAAGHDVKTGAFVVTPASTEGASGVSHATASSNPRETAPVTAGQDESNVQAIVRAVRMHWTADGGEARLRLEPEHLGQVTLTVRVERGSVTAHIQAETPEASQWIDAHQEDLRTSLREQGLDVKDVVVTTNPDGRRQQERAPRQMRARLPRQESEAAPIFEVIA